MDEKLPCVYILSNKPHGVLYTGVTSNLENRVWQHKQKIVVGFAEKYKADLLVWYEAHESIYHAITREKQIKKWRRAWKIRMIEAENPQWKDLYPGILG